MNFAVASEYRDQQEYQKYIAICLQSVGDSPEEQKKKYCRYLKLEEPLQEFWWKY